MYFVPMFTGLIEAVGTVIGARSHGRSIELCVVSEMPGYDVEIGGSVAVDGVCLTVEKRGVSGEMFFTAVSETLKRTTLDRAACGRKVNLERAMRLDGRLDGHIVLGHIDAVGRIVNDEHIGISVMRTIEVSSDLSMFMAKKGSIAVDGISLTIAKSNINTVTLSLIPATMERTTMLTKKSGDTVNIECDVLARYIYRMIKMPGSSESLIDKMERLGF